jgi:acyl-CoA synthetase (AMP-forming)/AMP-acid ligase II/NADP-dependent 3-hydroxy acid dehydrogenase YdfG
MDSSIERALMRTGAVEACAVCAHVVDGRPRRIAYVVPRPQVPFSAGELARQVGELIEPALPPDAYVEVSRLPLTPQGQVDETRLLALPVVDDALAARWEQALLAQDGVIEAAVVVDDRPAARPPLHLSDLVAGWNAAGETPAPASSADHAAAAGPTRPPSFADGGPLVIPDDAPRTLVDGLLRTALQQGERRIRLVRPDGGETVLTYAELLHAARCTLAGLRRIGMRAGDIAILQLPDLDEHFPTFWACLLGGIKPVTVAVPTAYDSRNAVVRKLFNTWQLLGRPRILAARRLVESIRGVRGDVDLAAASVVAVDELAGDPPAHDHHVSQPEDVAFFQLSSGSTGISKCIQITHRGVVHHIHGSQQHLGLSSDDVTLNWLPMDHVVPLLMYHTKDVYLGVEAVQVPGPVVLADPLKWLDYIEAYQVTQSWAPNFGFKMVADALAAAKDRRWDLSSLKGLVNAGEQVTLPVVRDFLDRVAPFGVAPSVMQPAFGMAEACTCMTYDHRFAVDGSVHRMAKSSLHGAMRPAEGDEAAVVFVDCGPVVRGVQIRIADKANTVVPEGTIGRLQIKGPVVTPGYLNNPAANEEAFVGDGWFNSGDLGFMWDGRLTLTGREKELIIVNGANFYCYEIEDLASGLPGVLPTFTAACGVADPSTGTEALAFFFVHDPASGTSVADTARRVRTEIAASAGLSPEFVVPVAKDEFPKTTSGKIQRGQLKQALLDGRFRDALKRLDVALENANTIPDWFYRPVWRRAELVAPVSPLPDGHRVILADAGGAGAALAARWRAEGQPVELIDAGDTRPIAEMLREIAAASGQIAVVAHLRCCDAADADADSSAERELARGCLEVLAAVQALASLQPERPAALVVGAGGSAHVAGGDVVSPSRAALAALVKTVAAEIDWLDCRLLDLPDLDAAGRAAVVALEIERASAERHVAYRGGARYVRRLERLDVSAAPAAAPLFRPRGVYLLTGGLGGVGQAVARDLLTRFDARLIVVGRTPLDEPAGAEPDDERLSALRELRKLSGEVRYAAADVADAPRLRALVEEATAHWGAPLDGIVHMAGVFTERPLLEETAETFLETVAPKVQGTGALFQLVADRPDAVFVTFSSAYGLLGGYGAGAYACGNAFLDGFAEARAAQPGPRVACLAWSLWNDTGMSRGYGNEEAARARGFRLMSRRHALLSAQALETRAVPHVLVGLDESGRAVRGLIEDADLPAQRLVAWCVSRAAADPGVGLAVADAFGHATSCDVRRVDALPRLADGTIDRRALTSGHRGSEAARVLPRTEIERTVAAVWQEALKQDGIGIHDNFFELGGTSFLAGQIAGRLRARLQADVVSTQMFQFPTIAAQAAFLMGESAPSEALATSQSRGASRRAAARRLRRGARPLRAD